MACTLQVTYSLISSLTKPAQIQAATPLAFPGAIGYGKNALGGRGGTIYKVTNLDDSGSGSLRECVEASGPRTCVFEVAGVIAVESALTVSNPYLTIAGQTAPSPGITIRSADTWGSYTMSVVDTNDVIIRHLKIRSGELASGTSVTGKPIILLRSHDVILDHLSLSWGTDEIISILDSYDVTVQHSIISEALHDSTHTEGVHSKGMAISGNSDGHSYQVTLYQNLIAHNRDRNPMTNGAEDVDLINNVIYNWWTGSTLVRNGDNDVTLNVIGNYYKAGPNTNATTYKEIEIIEDNANAIDLYVEDNDGPNKTDGNEWSIVDGDQAHQNSVRPSLSVSDDDILASSAVLDEVLKTAGALPYSADIIDERIKEDVRVGAGSSIDSTSDVGGWVTTTNSVSRPDADSDGIPDAWEDKYGLNKNSASDALLDRDGDGYSETEEYLNSTVPVTTITRTWTQSDWSEHGNFSLFTNERAYSEASNTNTYLDSQIKLSPSEVTVSGNEFENNTDIANWFIRTNEYSSDSIDNIANLALWLKPESLTALGNGGKVATWEDSSSAGNDATQGTVSRQPTVILNGLNGYPVAEFDQSNGQFLQLPEFMSSSDVTFFAVFDEEPTGNLSYVYYDEAGSNWFSLYKTTTDSIRTELRGGSIYLRPSTTNTSGDSYNVLSLSASGTTANVNVNGRTASRTDASYTVTTWESGQDPLIGAEDTSGTSAFEGKIAEIIVFNRDLTDAEEKQVRTYLNAKYARKGLYSDFATLNTSNWHGRSVDESSASITPTNADASLLNDVTLTEQYYNLEAYVYNGGSAVDASVASLHANGTTLSTTYSESINDWYKLEASFLATDGVNSIGVESETGTTVSVDDVSLYTFPSSGTMTSSILDTGQESTWETLTYEATTPLDSSVEVRIRTGNEADLSDAPAFSTCDAITSGSDISSNNCVTDRDRYVQYQVTLYPSTNPHTPTFEEFVLTFTQFVSSNNSSSSTSVSVSTPQPPGCSDTRPVGQPDLFQIDRKGHEAKLYFTPVNDNTQQYHAVFGFHTGDERFGSINMSAQNENKGVQSLVIDHLDPKVAYSFKVISVNGCAVGDWSNWLTAEKVQADTTIFYRYYDKVKNIFSWKSN